MPLFGKTEPKSLTRDQFASWLSGFIDGEGYFQLWFDKLTLRLAFRIKLHIDDVAVLYKIQNFLGVGRVKTYPTYCLFILDNVQELITVLFPLLDANTLYTTKYLDYVDFKRVVLLVASLPSAQLVGMNLTLVKELMSNMNSTRTLIDYDRIPPIVVNAYWLLGLIEGEGTFGLKNLTPYFQLGLHARQTMVLDAISKFLVSIPNGFNFTLTSLPIAVSETLNKKTDVLVLSNNNVDALHDYLAYFLLSMEFQSRKSVDFHHWCLSLHMHKLGYFYLADGRALILAISLFINDSRYSTLPIPAIAPSLASILAVLALPLPVSLTPQMSHLILAQRFSKLVTDRSI